MRSIASAIVRLASLAASDPQVRRATTLLGLALARVLIGRSRVFRGLLVFLHRERGGNRR